MTDPAPLSADDVLEHTPALRALSRHLVADGEAAEDLVQTTWLSALHRPPSRRRTLGAWLRTVMRNAARQEHRREQRRDRRERHAARSEAVPSAAEQLERLAVQREVVAAVEALAPLHREVVYLRWFEELPPRRIAARLGVPVRTVESRLRRATALLRQQLDRAHAGRRREWHRALAAVAWPERSFLPLWTGAAFMSTKIPLAAVSLLGAGLLVLSLWPAPTPEDTGTAATAPSPPDVRHAIQPDDTTIAGRTLRAADPPRSTPSSSRDERVLLGRVYDAGGTPLPDHRVEVVDRPGAARTPRTVTDATGGFRFTALFAGRIQSAEPEWVTLLAGDVSVREGETVPVVVAPARSLAGTVVDPQGNPLAGAAVTVVLPEGFRTRFEFPLDHCEDRTWRSRTDTGGRFALTIPNLDDGRVRARLHGYQQADRLVPDSGAGELRLVLDPLPPGGGPLHGVVLDADGEPVAGARVALGSQATRTDEAGRFDFLLEEGAPGDRLAAVAEGWQPAVLDRAGQPERRWPAFVTLQLTERPLAIDGVVLRPGGDPHPRAAVWLHDPTYFGIAGELALSAEHVMHHDERLWRKVTTDEAGRFHLPGLADREYELRAIDLDTLQLVTLPGVPAGSEDVRMRFSDGALLEELEGRVVDGAGVPIPDVQVTVGRDCFVFTSPRHGSSSFVCQERGARTTTGPDGTFRIPGVPRHGVSLRLHGSGLIPVSHRFPEDRVTTPAEIVVSRRCRVRVDVSGSPFAGADEVAFLDARGQPLQVGRHKASRTTLGTGVPLSGGRSEVLSVPDTAVVVSFRDGDEELGQRPVRPRPDSVTTVRW